MGVENIDLLLLPTDSNGMKGPRTCDPEQEMPITCVEGLVKLNYEPRDRKIPFFHTKFGDNQAYLIRLPTSHARSIILCLES